MKDIDVLNEVCEQEVWEDFYGFLAAEKWSDCEAVIQMMGDKGFENDAIRMNHVLNKAKSLGYLEPHVDAIPMFTEAEERTSREVSPMDNRNDGWTREGDEKFPPHEVDAPR